MTTGAPQPVVGPVGTGLAAETARRTLPPRRTDGGSFSGTPALVRLALRRDRVLLPVWVLGFAAMVAFSVSATRDLYPDEQSLARAAETINATAALVALYGKIYVVTSLGAVSLIKMTALGAAFVAILFVFLVVRHTRAEEESGRLELVAAGAVGRAAPLTAALVVGTGGSLVLGAVTALGLVAAGLPWAGSVAFGLGWAASGIVFSAVAAVTSQVTTSARAAIGLGMVVVAVAYSLVWIRRVSPPIVAPDATTGSRWDTTSPVTVAPSRSSTRPLKTTTSPFTWPEMVTGASGAVSDPSTLPSTAEEPWKTTRSPTCSPSGTCSPEGSLGSLRGRRRRWVDAVVRTDDHVKNLVRS